MPSYIKRFGWLAGASLRAWAQVKAEQPDRPDVLDYEQVLAQRRAREAQESGDG